MLFLLLLSLQVMRCHEGNSGFRERHHIIEAIEYTAENHSIEGCIGCFHRRQISEIG